MLDRNWFVFALLAAGGCTLTVFARGALLSERRRAATSCVARACLEGIGDGSSCSLWNARANSEEVDPWGSPVHCEIGLDRRASAVSYGADGKPGGAGQAADIHCTRSANANARGGCSCR